MTQDVNKTFWYKMRCVQHKRRNISGIYIFDKFPDDEKWQPTCIEDCSQDTRRAWLMKIGDTDYAKQAITMVYDAFIGLCDYLHNEGCIKDEWYKDFIDMAKEKKEMIKCNSISHYFPATKEQRDLLFQKMKDAGYGWDSATKEIKRIPKFKIGDKVHCGDENQPVTIIGITNDSYITDSMMGPILFSEEDNWTSIKYWSEKDDNKVKEIIEYLNEFFDNDRLDLQELNDYETWFKSIKQRLVGEI